jgi:hypothetical protein
MTKTDIFWNWFISNRTNIEKLFDSDPPTALRMIEKELHTAAPDLVFEVSPKARPRELVISADGNAKYFGAVAAFTQTAPEIPGWKVIAFRQPDDLAGVDYKAEHLDRKSVFVEINRSPEGFVDLVLYLPYARAKNQTDMEGASVLLLDSCLGEYVAVKRIRHVNFVDIKKKSVAAVPFDNLKNYFRDHAAQITDYK